MPAIARTGHKEVCATPAAPSTDASKKAQLGQRDVEKISITDKKAWEALVAKTIKEQETESFQLNCWYGAAMVFAVAMVTLGLVLTTSTGTSLFLLFTLAFFPSYYGAQFYIEPRLKMAHAKLEAAQLLKKSLNEKEFSAFLRKSFKAQKMSYEQMSSAAILFQRSQLLKQLHTSLDQDITTVRTGEKPKVA